MNVKIILRIFLLCLVFIQTTGVAGALSLTEIGNYDTTGWTNDVVVSGSYAYIADYGNGLVIVDIRNPTAPVLAGSYDTPGIAVGVAVSGSYAYIADHGNGLVIVDIRNPAAPVLAGSYDTPENTLALYVSGVAVSGSYAYVANDNGGLMIVDIRNPAAPTLAGRYDTPGVAWDVAVSGSYAYVADDNGGFVIVDIRNPAAPTLAGRYDAAEGPWGVVVSGSYAYIADYDKGLAIFDIRNPSAPALVGSYNTPGVARGVAVSGSYAYVADDYGGLVIVDIRNPSAPVLAGSYDTMGRAWGVAVSGSYVYVADYDGGLVIIGGGTSGSISVTSSPSGASVYLDGVSKGTTPLTISSVSAELHTIKLTHTGYVDLTHAVNVDSYGTTSFSGTLTLIPPPTGSISVSSSPSDASVYLDGAYKGRTPLTIESISIGSHALKLAKDGYSEKIKSVIIKKDNTEKVSMLLEASKDGAAKSTNLIDANAPETDNKKSGIVGGIGAILSLLYLMGIVATIRKKSKTKGKSISPYSANSTSSPQPTSAPKITSAFGYKGATIQYKVKVENPTSEPIADIKINLYVPDVFLASESTRTITMLKPSESKTVTFEIRPTGECGDCEVSGKVVYYDYSTKKTTGIDIPPKSLSIVCPMLKGKEISKPEWHGVTSNSVKTEESTRDLDMPAKTLFEMTSRIVKDMNMHQLEPEITDSPQLFNGVARFYGEGVKGLKYVAQVEVVGGAKKSRLILKTWAEKEEALTGFYHGLLDEIEKRVSVKGYIDDSIVQNFYHNGDNIGTQVKDSIVQRSNIGTGAGDKKCSNCNTVVDASSEFCNKCGEKLEL